MPTYTRSELLIIRELMSQRRNSSANAAQPSNAGEATDLVQSLWKKTKDIQKHVADLIQTINRRKLKGAGKEKRIRKVFRFAWISLAEYHRQLQEQVYSMTMLVMPPIFSQLQPTDVESWMELIAKFKKQALENCKQLKDLQMLLKYQMTLLEARFADIDQAIEELKVDCSDEDSSTEKTE